MATHKLFLLPGDGIGPEVMAEAEKVIRHFADEGVARFEIEKGLVGGCAYDAHGKAISEEDMALRRRGGRGAARGGRRAEMGQGSLRGPPRGGPAQAAQGSRALRQSPAGDLLPGARLGLVPENAR